MSNRYSMIIRWSQEDQVFVVSLPEFGDYIQTHGDTYEEAARNGHEVLELLVESFQGESRPLPAANFYSEEIMNYMTADQALLERLAGVMEPVEIRDPSGKVLGRYTPVFSDEKEAHERAAKYFDLAEAERIAATEREGRPLAEVWERIRACEIQE